MDFNKMVTDMVESVQGGIAAMIMASDGIALAEYIKPGEPIDIQTLGVEYSGVIGEMKKTSDVLEAGKLEEITICSESLTFIIRLITDEYFIAIALAPEGNYGKGRYLVRVAAPKLVEEL